jgi:hypothetical protein
MYIAVTILTSSLHVSFSYSSYQKDERAKTRNLLKIDALSSPTHKLSVTTLRFFSFFLLFTSLFLLHQRCQTARCVDDWSDNNSVKYIINVLLLYHVTAVVKLYVAMQFEISIKPKHTLGGNGCLSAASGRSRDRPTDRPAISTPVSLLPLSYRQVP